MSTNNSLTLHDTQHMCMGDEYTLYPNDVVTIHHYNGFSIKFQSPGFCRLVYRGGFGFDVIPIHIDNRVVELTFEEPPLKQSL